ncbi:MAG: four helix bundle protein [Bacteroidota bacterium]
MYNLEDLDAWKLAREFRKDISKLTKAFPNEEKFSLTSQILRASRSIAANIAEGFGRFHFQENVQFCRQARGSLYETLEHIYCALDEQYITQDEFNTIKLIFDNQIKVLNGYILYLKNAKSQTNK